MDKILPKVHVSVFKGRAFGAKHILSFSKTCIFEQSFDVFFKVFTDFKTGLFQRQRNPGIS